jgi:glycosyltransferase involved in cell wall biosynthesis
MYRNIQFDAIVSFNLVETGGIAWRIGQELGIPASGWAFGNDVRFPRSSALGQVVRRAIERLDIVFYQSHELLEQAAGLLGMPLDRMLRNHHIVLSHGIPEPPSLPKTEIRNRMRAALGIPDRQIAIFSLGRIVREKGIYELLDAISLAIVRDSRLTCAIVGSNPTFDETTAIQKKLDQTPGLQERVRLLPACNPDKVWDYLCAADIFVFPSHKEGMPNSLLEAMAMGIPAVAFAIPPVLEIDAGSGGLIAVPPFDPVLLSEAILFLASSPDNRVRIGERGREQVLDRFMVRKNMASALDRITKRVQKRLPLQNRYCHESASS